MIFKKAGQGQSIIEYTMLIIVVGAALMAMTTYISRSVNARIKQTQDEFQNSMKNERKG